MKVPLCSDRRSYERLEMLEVLRHAIAHCNGRLDKVKGKKRNKIMIWVNAGVGISIEDGNVLISETFLRETYSVVKELLQNMIWQIK